jgi:hypothetical protein
VAEQDQAKAKPPRVSLPLPCPGHRGAQNPAASLACRCHGMRLINLTSEVDSAAAQLPAKETNDLVRQVTGKASFQGTTITFQSGILESRFGRFSLFEVPHLAHASREPFPPRSNVECEQRTSQHSHPATSELAMRDASVCHEGASLEIVVRAARDVEALVASLAIALRTTPDGKAGQARRVSPPAP